MEELISSYASSDEEEKKISNKRKESPQVLEEIQTKKKVVLPPLPKDWLDEDEQQTPLVDSFGKIRNIPHVVGNWATFVYITVPEMSELRNLFDEIINKVHFNKEKLQLMKMENKELHISLSRTLYLREHQIHPFANLLKESFANKIGKKSITFGSYCWFLNDERNRTFLSLKVTSGASLITSMIKIADKVVKEFGFPVYYQNPIPHLSFAWISGDVISQLKDDEEHFLENPISFEVEEVFCKSGKLLFKFR